MPEPAPVRPTFREALRFWGWLGCVGFGGPAGQIALMHAEVVERRRWIDEGRFLHALNFCMLLPGPEAQQLATYLGWRLHGIRGGLAAGILFVLPGALLLLALSWLYVAWGHLGAVAAAFDGLKPAVLALVVSAGWKIGRKALQHPSLWAVAGATFAAFYFFDAPFPLLIGLAALYGGGMGRWKPGWFSGSGSRKDTMVDLADASPPRPAAWKVLLIGLLAWSAPIATAALLLGADHTVTRQGVFFSQAALVTFGGAYAVLPYVAEQAVQTHDWLGATQMMDGLGLAETTPGPLVLVLQFVGFLGGWQHPGSLAPGTAALLGAAVTTWATFAPSFLFIFLGAPHLDRLREFRPLAHALTAVTAAVVGVILNLSVWFATHLLLPETGGFNLPALLVSVAAFLALQRFKSGLIPVLMACAALGVAAHFWR